MGMVLHALPAAAGIPVPYDCVLPQGPMMVIYASEAIVVYGFVDRQWQQKPLAGYRSTRHTNQQRLIPLKIRYR